MRPIFTVVLWLFTLHSFAQNKDRILVSDLYKIKTASAVKFSPDGKWYVYNVRAIVPNEEQSGEYDYRQTWFLAPADFSTAPRAITNQKENSSDLCWSADHQQLFFTRLVKGKSQLFSLPLNGGEATQLTDFRYGVTNPSVSRDGKTIVFSASLTLSEMEKDSVLNPGKKSPLWSLEKPRVTAQEIYSNTLKGNADGNLAEIRAYLQQNEKEKKAKVFNRLDFQGEAATNPELTFTQLFSLALDRKSASPVALTSGFYNYNLVDISPDNQYILVNADLNPGIHPDRSIESAIYRISMDGGKPELILSEAGQRFEGTSISPDGKWMSFVLSPAKGIHVGKTEIYNFGTKEQILVPLERNLSSFTWSRDSHELYFLTSSNGGNVLYNFKPGGRVLNRLSGFDSGITSFDLNNTQLVYSKMNSSDPSEVYAADLQNKASRRISNLNTDWLAGKKLSIPVKKTFMNDQGMEVEYWVMKPAGIETGKKYPVILEIHGGPSAMWGPGESSMWHEFQYYTGLGYGVVYSNPRGSGGYSEAFLRANIKDWGEGPMRDVIKALDLTIGEGWADTTKQFVTGGSYAGYLTAWIVGHTDRFKAACAQRGVYDLTTFFGEGNAWRLVPEYFGGYPWEKEAGKLLRAESPFTYVDQIHTPLIIFHGETDLRTGVIQSEMMYKALKVLGREVEYVRHPGGTHELTRSGNNRQRTDQMLRTMEFFERYR
ncbi:S9 family peptidase [Pedobacter cryoconitis]|uniref:Dipeptidyl aminopeptidase/acylaminoacyl peptidase n=1 Tax=Pedobacter cryoconitis TaxID=188932 RepID=A0A7X0MID7_9SPHI|nr:S9 family peptidase [Pedobacter cryoconitis]MBB6500044.1 dipeptidyl aminopeptidase/acylaminoacyl peptidase [Pedobacter cryoconitis]